MTVQGSLGLLPSALGLLTFESAADANSLTPYGTNPQMPCTTIDQQQASMMLDSLASAMHTADPWVSHNSASLTNNQVTSQAPLSAFPGPPPPPSTFAPGMLTGKLNKAVHWQHSLLLIAAAQLLRWISSWIRQLSETHVQSRQWLKRCHHEMLRKQLAYVWSL